MTELAISTDNLSRNFGHVRAKVEVTQPSHLTSTVIGNPSLGRVLKL